MRYQVHGTRTVILSTYVDAEDEHEALEKAYEALGYEIDEWDEYTDWHHAMCVE
jgi:hypothetical protein